VFDLQLALRIHACQRSHLIVSELHLYKRMRCLFVDSRDRITGSTTDFKIQLPTTLVLEQGTKFRIDNLRIPMVIPLIQQGVNHRLYVRVESGGSQYFYASLPQGSYSGVELAQLISTT